MSTADQIKPDLQKIAFCSRRRCSTCGGASCQEFVVRFVRLVDSRWVREQISVKTTSAERAVRVALARLKVKPREIFVSLDREGKLCGRDSVKVQVVDSTPISTTYEVLRCPLTIRKVSSAKAS